MLALKVRKIGNSLGLVLPREALSRLNVSEGETLYLTESPDNTYRLTAYDEAFAGQVREAEAIMKEDRDILRELAHR